MLSNLSSYFVRLKRHFFKTVEDAKQPSKRSLPEMSDEEEIFTRTSFVERRKKQKTINHCKDEPFVPVTNTILMKAVNTQRIQGSSLPSIEEEKQYETKKTVSSRTPLWDWNRDVSPSTSSKGFQPVQRKDTLTIKKMEIHRGLPHRKKICHPMKHLSTGNQKRPMLRGTQFKFSSKRWESFTFDQTCRMEEKRRYQQLIQKCIEDENVTSLSSSFKSPSTSLSNLSGIQWLSSSETISDENSERAVKTPLSIKGLAEPTKSVTNHGKKEEQTRLTGIKNLHYPPQRKNSPIPLIDLSQSDSESNHSSSDSDSDSVEIVDEFPIGRKNTSTYQDLYDKQWIKNLHQKATIKTNDEFSNEKIDGEELDKRIKQSQNISNKVESRLKLLGLISGGKGIVPLSAEKPPFVPLSDVMKTQIMDALTPYPKSEVLVENFKIRITRRDMYTLNGQNWLNDEIINFYFSLIMERSKGNKRLPKVYAFSTFFYPTLCKGGHKSVSRWTRKVDVFAYDILLVPIHLDVHWCVASVDFHEKCISYYDSMLGNNSRCLQILSEYLGAEHLVKNGTPFKKAWTLENKKEIPEQMNGSDCGVFSCQFAEYKSRLAEINFSQADMPYFRKRMVYEIINGILLVPEQQ